MSWVAQSHALAFRQSTEAIRGQRDYFFGAAFAEEAAFFLSAFCLLVLEVFFGLLSPIAGSFRDHVLRALYQCLRSTKRGYTPLTRCCHELTPQLVSYDYDHHTSRKAVLACRRFPYDRRSTGRRREAGRRPEGRQEAPDTARRHRIRQDVHDGQPHRSLPAADARALPQQDPRRAALLRVPRVLPRKRRRVLRLLL